MTASQSGGFAGCCAMVPGVVFFVCELPRLGEYVLADIAKHAGLIVTARTVAVLMYTNLANTWPEY